MAEPEDWEEVEATLSYHYRYSWTKTVCGMTRRGRPDGVPMSAVNYMRCLRKTVKEGSIDPL